MINLIFSHLNKFKKMKQHTEIQNLRIQENIAICEYVLNFAQN